MDRNRYHLSFFGNAALGHAVVRSRNFYGRTRYLGYPDYFAYALTICEVLGATALIIPNLGPKIKEWAYAGMTFNLMFAIISHAVVDKGFGNIVLPLVIGGILAVSYIYNAKIRAHGQGGLQAN